MTVSNSWLVNVSLGINTTVVQSGSFNQSMLLGVMPTQTIPYQCPPSSWGTNLFKVYTSASEFDAEFDPIISAAITAGNVQQVNRFTWLQDAVHAYFAQIPSPLTLTVMRMDPPTAVTSYSSVFSALTVANNNWYGFEICDNIPIIGDSVNNFSIISVTMDLAESTNFYSGTVVTFTGVSPTQPYVLFLESLDVIGSTTLTFYSLDTTTAIPINTVTGIKYGGVALPGITITASTVNDSVAYSMTKVTAAVNATGPAAIPAGCYISSTTITTVYPFFSLNNNVLTPGLNLIDFYSPYVADNITIGSMTDITYGGNVIENIDYPQTNPTPGAPYLPEYPGILTPVRGIVAALQDMRSTSKNNPKKLFLDSADVTIAQQVQAAGGNKDLMFFYHSLNLQPYTSPTRASFSSACLSRYFVDLFYPGIGLKTISSMQITGQPLDSTINTANIGQPGVEGSSSNLIGWNNNVYAGFGSLSPIGLVQYGFVSSSTANQLVYLDQVVGSDYLQLTAQADLVTFIISQQPFGGIQYNDFGIQQIVSVFKQSIQKAVAQNIIQDPLNSAFVYTQYSNVTTQDITNRQYKNLVFNGKFLSRIQQIGVSINLSL